MKGQLLSLVLLCRGAVGDESGFRSRDLRFDPATIEHKMIEPAKNTTLEFVHISMTGGKTIERSAFENLGIKWGVCHFMDVKAIGCFNPDFVLENELGPRDSNKVYKEEPWLAPPRWFPSKSPYEGKELFTVVRNPYDRVVGEYRLFGSHQNQFFYADQMNRWIQRTLDKVQNLLHFPGHFLPQHYYVFDSDGTQIIPHVLRYESLEEDFQILMAQHGLDEIELPSHAHDQEDDEATFSRNLLSLTSIELINELYEKDFELLNYTKVNSVEEMSALTSEEVRRLSNSVFSNGRTLRMGRRDADGA